MSEYNKDKPYKLAIIGAGYMAMVFAKKAREIGVVTYCFAWDQGAIAKDYVDFFYPISIFEKDKILDKCKSEQIDGVIPTTELTISISAYISEKLGLNGNTTLLADKITNKYWVRSQSDNCKLIFHPRFMLLESSTQSFDWDIFPAIVKPTSEGGKRGIVVVNNKEQLKEVLSYAFSFDKKENGILIEEYIDGGKEYSVEGLSFNGNHQIIQITEKISSGPPHCVELGHHQPASVSSEMKSKISRAVCELLKTLSFLNGPTHTEIKIVKNDIYLIELNARPGGDHIAAILTQLSTGYDYIKEIIMVALNNKPTEFINSNNKCAGIYFVTEQTAYLRRVFDSCDKELWLYEKHLESDKLDELSHNDCLHTNYMIYYSPNRIEFSE